MHRVSIDFFNKPIRDYAYKILAAANALDEMNIAFNTMTQEAYFYLHVLATGDEEEICKMVSGMDRKNAHKFCPLRDAAYIRIIAGLEEAEA